MRVVVLFDNFGPYHLARLKEATRYFEIVAVQARGTSHTYEWNSIGASKNFQIVTLYPTSAPLIMDWRETSKRIDKTFSRVKPDAIAVPGWAGMAPLVAAHWGLRNRIPLVVFSDSNEHDHPRSFIKECIKSKVLEAYTTALTGNEAHQAYLEKLGFPNDAIFTGYDVVDNSYFSRCADVVRADGMPCQGPGVILSKGDFGRYFLGAARFVRKKNLSLLVDAYAEFRDVYKADSSWPLVLLGDGELRPILEARISALGLESRIFLPGFIQYETLPLWYASAGVFILPSHTEQWGLVVNEAMASGLPVIVSRRCGCASSLVEEGVNGSTFDPTDCSALAKLMFNIVDRDVREMGKNSQHIIAKWGPERFAKSLAAAVTMAKSRGPKRASPAILALLRLVGSQQEHRAAEIPE